MTVIASARPVETQSVQLTDMELAELLCTKFCHDLAGPIGAVNNGVEFLKEENFTMIDQAVSLIQVSAQESVARMQFFRMAYGVAKTPGEANLPHLKQLADAYFSQGKIKLEWSAHNADSAPVSLTHKMGKTALNLLVIAASALIHGGVVTITLQQQDDKKKLHITGKGKGVKLQPETLALLQSEPVEAITSRNVQPYYTMQLIKELHGKLRLELKDELVEIHVSLS